MTAPLTVAFRGPDTRDSPGDLLGLLSAGAAAPGHVTFLPSGARFTRSRLWDEAAAAGAGLAARVGRGATVAAVFASTPECLAALFGAWRAGVTVASLPHPARAMPPQEYRRQIDHIARTAGADLLLVERALVPTLEDLSIPTVSFEDCPRGSPRALDETQGALVQFTSGSTGSPKGVALGLDAVACNVRAILEAIEPVLGDVACSWLPLSHDMGLIGLCLSGWVGAGRDFAARGDLVFIRPEAFLVNPNVWLSVCSEFRATITCSPNFGFDLARRALRRNGTLDVRALRCCITGAEPVRAATLREFAAATGPAGFRARAICPAYGFAEASLAVTAVRPDEDWSSASVDAVALARGQWIESTGSGTTELVGNGAPVAGTDVRIAGGADVGEIEVSSASLLDRYVGSDEPVRTPDGWFRTRDLGCIRDGQLYVAGRIDDIIIVAGRTLLAPDIEAAAERARGVRPGTLAALQDDNGYLVVAERPRGRRTRPDLERVCTAIRLAATEGTGVSPRTVLLIAPRSFPKTPSGKPQRQRLRAALGTGDLRIEAELSFGRRTAGTPTRPRVTAEDPDDPPDPNPTEECCHDR